MSYIGTSRSIWPRVSSLYAHDVVQTAFDLVPMTDRSADMTSAHHSYRAWLRGKLADSQLAELLPGGTDLLPDYYAALPAWQRPFAMFSKPRSYADLTRHIVSHLDWYLDPGRQARALRFMPVTALLMLCLLGGMAGLLASLVGATAFLVLAVMLPIGVVVSVEPYKHMHRDINAQEFYDYIKAAYADPTDYEGGFDLSELAAEHRAEVAREAQLE